MTEDPGWLNMRGLMIVQYDEKGARVWFDRGSECRNLFKSFHSILVRTVSPRCTESLVEVAP